MIKAYDDNPKVNDQVEFILYTPDNNNCFLSNPYAFIDITIYYINRDFANQNLNSYDTVESQKNLETRYYTLNNIACENPTTENIIAAQDAKSEFINSQIRNTFYYKNTSIVFYQGSATNPLWLADNSVYLPIVIPDPNLQFPYGRFKFIWNSEGVREGDYFICYKWKPNISGDTLSAHLKFYLESDINSTTSNPTHRTPPNKYYDLLNLYLPEMYKQTYTAEDKGPSVLDKLNKSVGKGFTAVENLANQIIDLYDSNVIQEQLLPYLAGNFNLVLRNTDPTRWRKQVGNAIPLYKKKGTYAGLEEALNLAGITIIDYSQLWQVGTEYTYTESFAYTGEVLWELEKVSLPVNDNFFILEIENNTTSYAVIALSNIEINSGGGKSYLKWLGKELEAGDRIKITYQIKEFSNETQIQIHNYILSLPLADTRDDRTFVYPKKDWNTRLIDQKDPFFDTIINVKNPFYDPVKFGKIRTEFPYSEQAYNMDEYNGSLRDSYDPKDIDKNFIEPCRNTISSYYNIDLLIQDLSNTRLIESQEIISQFTPFHAILHTLRFSGYYDDIIVPAVESIQCLLQYNGSDFTISGNANPIFTRNMVGGLTYNAVLRNVLASQSLQNSGTITAYNDEIILYSNIYNLDTLGLADGINNNMLEILSPHPNAGIYSIDNPTSQMAKVVSGSPTELLNTSDFTFRLSNIIFSSSLFNIFQDNIYKLTDTNETYAYYPIKTIWDVQNGYADNSWKIYLNSTGQYYDILNLFDNVLTLENNGSLPNSNDFDIGYKLVNENNNIIFESTLGQYSVTDRARIEVSPSLGYTNIKALLDQNNYFYYDTAAEHFKVIGYDDNNGLIFYISDWIYGDMSSVNGKLLKRLLFETTGSFNYNGMKLLKPIGWPAFTSISDPSALENSTFIENYLFDYAGSKYALSKEETVGGNTYVYILGKLNGFGTQSYGGTSISYNLYRYVKTSEIIMGNSFDFIDRSGQQAITNTISSMSMAMVDQLAEKTQNEEISKQIDGIQYSITTKNGEVYQGEI